MPQPKKSGKKVQGFWSNLGVYQEYVEVDSVDVYIYIFIYILYLHLEVRARGFQRRFKS